MLAAWVEQKNEATKHDKNGKQQSTTKMGSNKARQKWEATKHDKNGVMHP